MPSTGSPTDRIAAAKPSSPPSPRPSPSSATRSKIDDPEWIAHSDDHAVCRYRFTWTGTIDSQPRSGSGRGTNVLVNNAGTWQMLHEHLSA
ncbi:nuclear transport factor 2 family protein [Streptomyces sp. NPDC057460]|uniref:nuclear transport factor 2 family protein n=1 Tax=Streptomyces sp. NPDC057460 TaxID=3346141 RepID=UPI00369A6FD0